MPDARGHFNFNNLAPGTYEVILTIRFDTTSPAPRPPLKQFVSVADGAEAELTFTVDLKATEGGPQ